MKIRNMVALILFAGVMFGVWQFRVWREGVLVKDYGGIELPDISESPTERADRHAAKLKARLDAEREASLRAYTNELRRIEMESAFWRALTNQP